MASTTVYGCDWCGEIVPKRASTLGHNAEKDIPNFAAKITAEQLFPLPPMAEKPTVHEICNRCHMAFKALTQGKYRR